VKDETHNNNNNSTRRGATRSGKKGEMGVVRGS
jgi:hypothetical protein